MSFGCILVALELLDGGFHNELLRLGALIDHVQIRPFKVNAQNLGALVAVFHNLGYIGYRLGEDFLTLGNGGRQECGHAFPGNMLCPVAESFFVGVVGVEAVGAVAVDVQKTGNNAQVFIVRIGCPGPIGKDVRDSAVLNFNGGRGELICNPYFFFLY